MHWVGRSVVALALVVLGSCGAPPPVPDPTVFEGSPALEELPSRRWVEIRPGSPTICARRDPFAYWVYPDDPRRLVIHFAGGGACWDSDSCQVARPDFNASVEADRQRVMGERRSGIFDMSDPRNPFARFTHVYIGYCTGDVHWGDARTDHGSSVIEHRGAVNAAVVLDWVFEQIPEVETVVVTGCSAGGYGALLWSGRIFEHYSTARQVHLSDSASGIVGDAFLGDVVNLWGVQNDVFPEGVRLEELSAAELLPELYRTFGNQFSGTAQFSQYTSTDDDLQLYFYTRTGGQGGRAEYARRLLERSFRIADDVPNYRHFLASSPRHCIITSNGFYSERIGDVNLRDWLESMVSGIPVENAECTTCSRPEGP